MDVVNVVLKPVVETLMVPVKEQLGYLVSYRKYVMEMRTKMAELNAKRHAEEDHVKRNKIRGLEISSQVRGWLEEVEKVEAKVKEIVSSDVGSCCSLKIRHTVGRTTSKIIKEIESVTIQHAVITWTDHPIPLGRVDSMKASTSTPSTDHSDFRSREVTFTKALEALGQNQRSHMIALCGMGGVGKTTMMERLKKVAEERKLFYIILQVVIGEKTNPIAMQDAIADYLGVELKEKTQPARADKLRKEFKAQSEGGKNKFLVILDDVWQPVDLKDIGLSPFPDQGVDFKVLLTSRDKHVCTMMGVENNSILSVGLLTEEEAQSLFHQFVETSDPELHKIGKDIIRKCCGLPIAIKTMACTLKNRRKDAWIHALSRLENNDIGNAARNVFKTSYDNLEDDEIKSVFMLCGLFPEDFNIPTEELMRYGWGLKLFKRVSTIIEARQRLHSCSERLRETNLLIESDNVGCVKMHDLVRAFVLDMFSEAEHSSIVNHGNMSETWPEEDDVIKGSCKRISVTCKGMSEIPQYLNNFPNLLLLKLMHGDKSLRFPQDFYREMWKLQVISYDQMEYPLLTSSPQCSTNLRVLHLHKCSLMMFDCSSIGNHLNLEVLSFANSNIECLPTTIKHLKKLKLLDLTNCASLRLDNGVLQDLVKLEELYMGADGEYGKAISLTNENYKEIAKRSENLTALEFEFLENDVQPKKMSFKRLQKFKISVGCCSDKDFRKRAYPFENMLKLETNKGGVLESGMNQFFEKTEVLYLSVGDMNDLSDVEVESSHPPQSFSFQNLRVLVVSKCRELKYLFTLGVVNTLSRLEHLKVYKCDNMEELIHIENGGEETITFSKLKYLSLCGLPNLSGLCDNVSIIKLPQLVELELKSIPGFTSIYHTNKLETSSLLKEEILMPKLEKLHIDVMKNLKEIWPREFETSEEVNVPMLRGIEVRNCDSLVNLFPSNPMPFIHHLEDLVVGDCGSIEVLFDIDLDSVGETEEGSSLRSIQLKKLGKLREVWRIKGAHDHHLPIRGFQAVKSISIQRCRRFRKVFTPITANFDLPALMDLSIDSRENRRNDESAESNQEQEEETEEALQVGDIMSNVVIPSCLLHSLRNLRKLEILNYKGMEAVFEMESPRSRELATTHDNQRLLPYLKDLEIYDMESMSHVWKCNSNKYLILRKQPLESPFPNLETIQMNECKSIKYLFSPHMAKLLSNLKEIEIYRCDGIEEVVPNKDDEDEENTVSTSTSTHTSCTTLFPRLDSLNLHGLPKLRCIGGGGGGGCANGGNNKLSLNSSTITTPFVDQFKDSEAGGVSWSLCQYATEIQIKDCHALSSVIPWYAAGQMQKLQKLSVRDCHGMKEVFETEGMKRGCDEDVNDGGIQEEEIPRLNLLLKLPNLKTLHIVGCGLVEHVFPFSALESLKQLQELEIENCKGMKVIVKQEDGEKISSSKDEVVFPRLKSIELLDLPNLVGFFLGMNEFQLPSLEKVRIRKCPQMTAFTRGGSTAPRLKYMNTSLGKHSLGESGLNFHLPVITTTAHHHQTPLFPISYAATSQQGIPCSFHNLIEINMIGYYEDEKIIPSNELLQLQNLEKILVMGCDKVEEVFEAGGGNCSSSHESQTTTTLVNLPNLREVQLWHLYSLRYIWKSNEWTVFQFPNLTKISIYMCKSLQHVFTSSMVGSLLQLQELGINRCKHMEEVIVKDSNDGVEEEEEESHAKTNQLIISFPRLKSLYLEELPSLKGFCLGMKEDFSFPLLDTLRIYSCPAITTFTKGNSTTPQLREIETNFGSFYGGEIDLNSFIKTKQEEFKNGL